LEIPLKKLRGNDLIPIAKPNLGEEEIGNVVEVLKSGNLAYGKFAKEFEKEFANYIGVKHAIAVSSGTSALCISLKALIKKGDNVLTTPFTFIATSNSIMYAGGKPSFADIEPETFNLNPKKVNGAKLILPVHLYGQTCDMDEMLETAHAKGGFVIEDACQSHGAEYKGKKVGSIGDVGCFSLYPSKNITSGEGGVITTNNDKIAEFCRFYRNHGQSEVYNYQQEGFNYRITDICASIALAQLKKLENFIKKRRENAKFLTQELGGIEGMQTPVEANYARHVYNQYTIRVKKRDKFAELLKKKGVDCRVYYPQLIPDSPYYKKLGYVNIKCPEAERACAEVLSIPVHPSLTEDELKYIVESVRSCASEIR
jgi:dTDP-4-amino-4,6-dideoxygalactose transaminase